MGPLKVEIARASMGRVGSACSKLSKRVMAITLSRELLFRLGVGVIFDWGSGGERLRLVICMWQEVAAWTLTTCASVCSASPAIMTPS